MGREIESVGVHQSFILLTGRLRKEVACIHKLGVGVKTCLIVASKELAEFEFKGRECYDARSRMRHSSRISKHTNTQVLNGEEKHYVKGEYMDC